MQKFNCSKIFRTFSSTELLCKECFLRAQNHKIKLTGLILFLPFFLFLIVFIYVILNFIGEIPLSLYYAGLLFIIGYVIFFLLMATNFLINKHRSTFDRRATAAVVSARRARGARACLTRLTKYSSIPWSMIPPGIDNSRDRVECWQTDFSGWSNTWNFKPRG